MLEERRGVRSEVGVQLQTLGPVQSVCLFIARMLLSDIEIEQRELCGAGSSFSAFGFLSFLMITFNLGLMFVMVHIKSLRSLNFSR